MEWDIIDELDERVVEASDWLPVSDYKKLQARSGVYIFTDSSFDVKYIGKAGAGRMVVENTLQLVPKIIFEVYSAIKRKKNTGATLLMALYTNSDSIALEYEQELINKYTPPNNGVDLMKS